MGMTYTKPKDVRYVDMCIYIDSLTKKWHPKDNPFKVEEEETIYKYLYLLYYNIACRKHFFAKFTDFDDYALWCATRAYTRLIDPRQFTGEMDRILSILNYVKATAYGWKLKWQQETFQTVINVEYNKSFDPVTFKQVLVNNIEYNNRSRVIDYVIDDIKLIPMYLRNIINETPYKDDKVLCQRLYITCLLSFNNSLLQTSTLKNVSRSYHKIDSTEILWHIDDSYKLQVELIMNKLRETIKNNIKNSLKKLDVNENDVMNMFWDQLSSNVDEEY